MDQVMGKELLDIIRRDRARRALPERIGKFIGRLVAGQIVLALVALINGWMLMLAVGVAHAEWITQLPTIGYWWAVLIVWLVGRIWPGSSATGSKD